jgi:hypothetical protein
LLGNQEFLDTPDAKAVRILSQYLYPAVSETTSTRGAARGSRKRATRSRFAGRHVAAHAALRVYFPAVDHRLVDLLGGHGL